MRASAVSFTHKLAAATLAVLLTLTLTPSAYAEEGEGVSEVDAGTAASGLLDQSNDPADSVIRSEDAEGPSSSVTLSGAAGGGEVERSNTKPPTLASGLVGTPSNFINSDVALDGEPVIGSFTVDGLTFAVLDGPYVELVGVSPSVALSEGSEAGEVEESYEDHASEAGVSNLMLPETVTYEGVTHIVSSVGAYAFYLSGISSVTLPASISNVDDRAFRSSDVASVLVADDNPFYSSFDGALCDADQLSLLLIPEGKQGAVLLPKTAEVAEASVFSHCPLVDSISVEKDGAAFASENGLLYTSDLTTLLRVPAGATEITIREGCTTIAAGALEACAKLERINAPASVTSISPDVFTAIPTVSLLAASLTGTDDPSAPGEPSSQGAVPQISTTVALPSTAGGFPKTDPSAIELALSENADLSIWQAVGFSISDYLQEDNPAVSTLNSGATLRKGPNTIAAYVIGGGSYSITQSNNLSCPVGSNSPHCGFVATSAVNLRIVLYSDGSVQVTSDDQYKYVVRGKAVPRAGYSFKGWNVDGSANASFMSNTYSMVSGVRYVYGVFSPKSYKATLDMQGGSCATTEVSVLFDGDMPAVTIPVKTGYRFEGFFSQENGKGVRYYYESGLSAHKWDIPNNAMLYAHWIPLEYNLGFDVDSEPGDEDYIGEPKDDQTVSVDDGPTAIEDPKRPGYVFQGWTVPNAEGTEAIDQDLVYEGEDGKWYVDASKLPDYAGDDGRVELTARWTSVVSVDVPSSVTFYADVVTQGNESREGLASSAFGQSKVQSQSEVDLRVVGLESKQVKGNGTTSLGASDILKKKDGSALPTASDKLLSLYPAVGDLEEDDLKDPDRTSAKPSDAVDFSLDDVLLEKSFSADKFTIPAGDTLSLGYRLNLSETDTVLDYDKLSALPDDSTASIATISYCFAADGLTPSDWQEPLWVEDPDGAGFLLLDDIKEAALDLSAHAPDVAASSYYAAYKKLFDADASFYLLVGDAYYDVRILGIGQDTMSDGGKAGLTFEMKGVYDEQVVPSSGAWGYNGSALQKYLEEDFYGRLGARMRDEKSGIVGVTKRHQVNNTMTLQTAVYQHVFVPSFYEIFGVTRTSGGWNNAESASNSFQYQHFAKGGANVNASPYRVKKDSTGAARIWVGRSAQYDGNLRTHISGAYMDGSMSRVSSGSPSWFAPCFCL